MRIHDLAPVLLLAGGLVLAGCGDDGPTPTATSTAEAVAPDRNTRANTTETNTDPADVVRLTPTRTCSTDEGSFHVVDVDTDLPPGTVIEAEYQINIPAGDGTGARFVTASVGDDGTATLLVEVFGPGEQGQAFSMSTGDGAPIAIDGVRTFVATEPTGSCP